MAAAGLAVGDGGFETTLVFKDGFDLPCFAAFPLLADPEGRAAIERYFRSFLQLADARGLPFVLDTATWRANPDWGTRLGYDEAALAAANADAAEVARRLVEGRSGVTVEGVLGPRGDGYVVTERMSADEAADYHSWQIGVLRDAGVDQIIGSTLTYPDEAVGIVRAAVAAGLPVVPSFTLETDGRLPDGTPLDEAIERVDEATGRAARFFMVNCAHPTHVARALGGAATARRIGGLRVNGSPLSHAELDVAEQLDADEPSVLASHHAALRSALPAVEVLGGCCGTDSRHVDAIVGAWQRTN